VLPECKVAAYALPCETEVREFRMGLLTNLKDSVSRVTDRLFASEDPKRIGIYGPPNAGKTTLANRIARDWTGDAIGPESHVPHETRRARRKEGVDIERNGQSVTIDIVDTPGVATKVDYKEFLDHDIEKDDAIRRSREATEGVAEAMHWLREDVDGVIYVLDSTTDPFTQVNTMLIGIIESRDLPVLIFANKIDLDQADIDRVADAFPQHETVPLSALEGDNMDEVYDKIAEYFA
jgi:GTPase